MYMSKQLYIHNICTAAIDADCATGVYVFFTGLVFKVRTILRLISKRNETKTTLTLLFLHTHTKTHPNIYY